MKGPYGFSECDLNQIHLPWEALTEASEEKGGGRQVKFGRPLFMKETRFHTLHLPRDIVRLVRADHEILNYRHAINLEHLKHHWNKIVQKVQ